MLNMLISIATLLRCIFSEHQKWPPFGLVNYDLGNDLQCIAAKGLLPDSSITLPKFNIAPENRPSQKETSLTTTIFQGLC